jgi:predicted DNA-binding transcriptional regulator AlpA
MKRADTNQWLTPLEFSKLVGLSRNSVYRRLNGGDIPQELLLYAGPRKILIARSAVATFNHFWKEHRGAEASEWMAPEAFAQSLGLEAGEIYRRMQTREFPPKSVRRDGPKRSFIHISALKAFPEFCSR